MTQYIPRSCYTFSPLSICRPDTVLQGIVDLVLGSLKQQQAPQMPVVAETPSSKPSLGPVAPSPSALVRSLSQHAAVSSPVYNKSLKEYRTVPLPFIVVKVEPATGDRAGDTQAPRLARPYIRTLGVLTVKAFQQYLASRLGAPSPNQVRVCSK